MTRRRKQSVRQITKNQVEEVLAKYADASSKHKEITAVMEQEIISVREKYAADLEAQNEVLQKSFDELQLWGETHYKDFEKKRTKNLAHGNIGFRTGTPKAKTLKGFTWAAATELIKQFLPHYLQVKEAPNKERLIADREQLNRNGMLKKIGVEVVQEETFFVEVKEEEAASV